MPKLGAALLIYILSCIQAVAGTLTAKQILERVAANYDAIQDYIVEGKVKVDSPSGPYARNECENLLQEAKQTSC